VTSDASGPAAVHPPRPLRRDAVRNHERILGAARAVLGEAGAAACIEDIAARAGVGVGTVYRRFTSKDALIDELLRLVLEELNAAADRALARTDGHGLEDLLRTFGQSFADHARYANLLLEREPDAEATRRIREAVATLSARAVAAGTIRADMTAADVLALIAGMRGLVQSETVQSETVQSDTVQAEAVLAPDAWQRFLDIHLAGMRPER
jgi:AcrR family transcriptional regulator